MKLYMHPVSTTARMVTMFAAEEGIPLEYEVIDLMTGQQHSPEYLKLNPNGLVPMLDDDGFRLTESGAILRYLAAKTGSTAYPTELRERARVEESMEWFYSNLYKDHGYGLIYPQILPHHRRPSDEAHQGAIAWGREKARHWLRILDHDTIGPDRRFLLGERITLADYVGAEIVGLGDLLHFEYREYPNVRRWMGHMKALPHWAATHAAFDAFAASLKGQAFVTV
jgi:glutathione S-transferase